MVKQIFPRVSASLSSSSSASDTYTGTPHRMTSVFSSCASGVFELSFAPIKLGVSVNDVVRRVPFLQQKRANLVR